MDYELVQNDGVFTLKNQNTTVGFVRFNELGEVEYIFVNPIFRKKGLAKKLLKLVREKTGKKIIINADRKTTIIDAFKGDGYHIKNDGEELGLIVH